MAARLIFFACCDVDAVRQLKAIIAVDLTASIRVPFHNEVPVAVKLGDARVAIAVRHENRAVVGSHLK